MSNLLTHSRLACAKTCLRKHQIEYVLGLRVERDTAPLRMGIAFHMGLDLRAQGETEEATIQLVREQHQLDRPTDAPEYVLEEEIVARMLAGYFWNWADWDEQIEVLASEIEFNLPLVNPDTGRASRNYRMAGKIDKIVRLADGRIAVMEHKTAGQDIAPTADYWRRLRIDSQISMYWLAAHEMGYKVETVLYDVMRKPSIAPKMMATLDDDGLKIVNEADGTRSLKKDGTPRQSADKKKGQCLVSAVETPEEFGERLRFDQAERPEFYFARREIPRLQTDLDEARHDLWAMSQILNDCDRNNRWPRNTGACIGFGRCRHFDLCTNGFNFKADTVPDGYRKLDNVHPELKEQDHAAPD